jgi:hypothetical protein
MFRRLYCCCTFVVRQLARDYYYYFIIRVFFIDRMLEDKIPIFFVADKKRTSQQRETPLLDSPLLLLITRKLKRAI